MGHPVLAVRSFSFTAMAVREFFIPTHRCAMDGAPGCAWMGLGEFVGAVVGGGVRVELGRGDEVGADGIVVDVKAAGVELSGGLDVVVGEAALPDREMGGKAVGEVAFEVLHGLREVR
jgi:hypothetical protein